MRLRPLLLAAGLAAAALALGGLLFARFAPAPDVALARAGGGGGADCVVLLHGLARTSRSMRRLGERLVADGLDVVTVDYPSRHFPIATLAELAIPPALDACRASGAAAASGGAGERPAADEDAAGARRERPTVHFVTHSLGGILVRQHLARHALPELGRIVMLAPPNRGSEVADAYGGSFLYRWLNGPAGDELGTGAEAPPRRLGPLHADVAVIAGTRSINPILSLSLPDPDDGKVSVAATRLDGMCAMLVVAVSHPFVMQDPRVIDEVSAYLAGGRFLSPAAEYPGCRAAIVSPARPPDGPTGRADRPAHGRGAADGSLSSARSGRRTSPRAPPSRAF